MSASVLLLKGKHDGQSNRETCICITVIAQEESPSRLSFRLSYANLFTSKQKAVCFRRIHLHRTVIGRQQKHPLSPPVERRKRNLSLSPATHARHFIVATLGATTRELLFVRRHAALAR